MKKEFVKVYFNNKSYVEFAMDKWKYRNLLRKDGSLYYFDLLKTFYGDAENMSLFLQMYPETNTTDMWDSFISHKPTAQEILDVIKSCERFQQRLFVYDFLNASPTYKQALELLMSCEKLQTKFHLNLIVSNFKYLDINPGKPNDTFGVMKENEQNFIKTLIEKNVAFQTDSVLEQYVKYCNRYDFFYALYEGSFKCFGYRKLWNRFIEMNPTEEQIQSLINEYEVFEEFYSKVG